MLAAVGGAPPSLAESRPERSSEAHWHDRIRTTDMAMAITRPLRSITITTRPPRPITTITRVGPTMIAGARGMDTATALADAQLASGQGAHTKAGDFFGDAGFL